MRVGVALRQPGWHGCGLQALYSLMCECALRFSIDVSRFGRFLDRAPGWYVHGGKAAAKVDHCSSQNGLIWAMMWEARTGTTEILSVASRFGSDQSAQQSRGVQLAELWI